ncbi:hypothetical protein AYO45_03590 [Gammaproteobacteria bacterium SCGC AG-212-F23]|nr:hypothetical protein AYO45_03590 [Gammaproteobacteria bacterium SCGC AG-212-F23]
MDKTLDVYFNEKVVGQLIQDDYGDINFAYSSDWLDDPKAIPISCSLPLQAEIFKKRFCQAFFSGILPEDVQRKLIAKNLGISANNDFSMLEKIGGECAGALSFVSKGKKFIPDNHDYHELTKKKLSNILRELPSRPLLAGDQGVRLSLAGVQDKLAVYVENEKISIPLDNSPSTHILKPDFGEYEGVIFNEAFCLGLAKKVGLPVAEVEIKQVEDIYYLLIKRYDRVMDEKKIKRIHQEDFCQALGILPVDKYQNEGGPSLKQCFDLIRRNSFSPAIDLERMLNAVMFNYFIGNCDAHGKNFSFLYYNRLQLAPLYDLVCTIYYKDLTQKMAMKLGGEYNIKSIRVDNFDVLAGEIGFSKPEVRKRVFAMIDAILSSLSVMSIQYPIQEKISNLIMIRCEYFAKRIS